MKNIGLFFLLCLIAVPATAVAKRIRVLRIDIQVNAKKHNGKSWDVGRRRSKRPDISLCFEIPKNAIDKSWASSLNAHITGKRIFDKMQNPVRACLRGGWETSDKLLGIDSVKASCINSDKCTFYLAYLIPSKLKELSIAVYDADKLRSDLVGRTIGASINGKNHGLSVSYKKYSKTQGYAKLRWRTMSLDALWEIENKSCKGEPTRIWFPGASTLIGLAHSHNNDGSKRDWWKRNGYENLWNTESCKKKTGKATQKSWFRKK
ncbi:MAG TPA: hypothetical protein EYN66_08665 [Myxococcales bacterium]|nr:hypothetical protein [Myxococcales bacterium]